TKAWRGPLTEMTDSRRDIRNRVVYNSNGRVLMTGLPLPDFRRLPNGVPVAAWEDESDVRWLLAVFLRSDIGQSIQLADEIRLGLDSAMKNDRTSWHWRGNSFNLSAHQGMCRLEFCDRDVPPHIRPADLACSEMQEILSVWQQYVAD